MPPKAGKVYVLTKNGDVCKAERFDVEYGMNDGNAEGFSDTFDLPQTSVKKEAYRIVDDKDKVLKLVTEDDVIFIDKWVFDNLFLRLK